MVVVALIENGKHTLAIVPSTENLAVDSFEIIEPVGSPYLEAHPDAVVQIQALFDEVLGLFGIMRSAQPSAEIDVIEAISG
jgi:hypothetical protein